MAFISRHLARTASLITRIRGTASTRSCDERYGYTCTRSIGRWCWSDEWLPVGLSCGLDRAPYSSSSRGCSLRYGDLAGVVNAVVIADHYDRRGARERLVEHAQQSEVDLVEALSSELEVHFTLDAVQVVAEGAATEDAEAAVIKGEGMPRVAPQTPVKAGDKITFAGRAEGMQFFDPVSEAAIWN